ncbi:hypothetical protein C6501_02015 [Candidatus Poribacteria bacterium]|nr:MAG: hypothetical protein C6501_02015 [Candidatus Poribacteria bacterium]
MLFWKLVRILLILLLCPMVARAKIIFISTSTPLGPDRYIYVMNDDGSDKTLVYDGKPRIWDTRWTPTGQIVFESQTKLYRINPDGTGLEELAAPGGERIGDFTVSPDGKKIMFDWTERIDGTAVTSVRVLDIETGKIRKIADMNFAFPDWSPDGRHIVYSTAIVGGGGGNSLWIMDADGRNPRQLDLPPPRAAGLNVNVAAWGPRWSPNSQQIVYTQEHFTWEPHGNGLALIRKALYIVICDRNGKTIRQLKVPKNLDAASFAWIDGGRSILFTGWERVLNRVPLEKEEPSRSIYKYNLRTDEMVQITNHPGDDSDIDWISDDVLSVTPQGKKKVTWGAIKE